MATALKKSSQKESMEDETSQKLLFYILEKIDKLDNKIDRVENNLHSKIDKLNSKIDRVENNLDSKIDKVENNLNSKIDSNHRWTVGMIITTIALMVTGFMSMVTLILSR